MFHKSIISTVLAIGALQQVTLAAPTDTTPNTLQARAWDGAVAIPDGKDAAISYTCESGAVADWSATKDTINEDCITIPGGSDNFEMNYDIETYADFSVWTYVNGDCTELDYGWWKNIWGKRGVSSTYAKGACIGSPAFAVQENKDTAKWNSFKVSFLKKEDVGR
ncbi:ubiquinone biosynthesis methyltransferase [Diplodia corticola]|uniref:Ubiquinone biosynthesis methyltransferase n=1 Tax=Diplodia corticola TaxID=236234 RepID=A0A1J9S6G4_9PEZI|nr:ubiquinone biosynthesis methyltransferase [Diplodia corticola]OJD35205.1 ubiquinone biosynthesis methyltransferase [Diplodia corticola]